MEDMALYSPNRIKFDEVKLMLINRLREPLNAQYEVCLIVTTFFAFVSVSVGPSVWHDQQSLFERLQVAEEVGLQVSRDLSSMLEQLMNISKAANTTCPASNPTSTGSILNQSEKHVVGSS